MVVFLFIGAERTPGNISTADIASVGFSIRPVPIVLVVALRDKSCLTNFARREMCARNRRQD
jgi:hypothetical protein